MGKAEARFDWLVIVNPNAGHRKGKKDWAEISALLATYGFSYEAGSQKRDGMPFCWLVKE